jgi:hypothetical protein
MKKSSTKDQPATRAGSKSLAGQRRAFAEAAKRGLVPAHAKPEPAKGGKRK